MNGYMYVPQSIRCSRLLIIFTRLLECQACSRLMCQRDMLVNLIPMNPVAIVEYIPSVHQVFDVLHNHP